MRFLYCFTLLAVAVAQGQGVNTYSKNSEIALGQHLAMKFRQKTTPLQSTAAIDYIKRVGANLAAQLPGGWTFHIEATREDEGGALHEPTAFPGGNIFVSADLITTARDEAEFAGMLAHAMAHVVARHGTRLATRGQLIDPAKQNVMVIMQDNSGGSVVPAGLLSFERTFEREADFLAVKAMAAAGYDPAGLSSYVGRVQPAPGTAATLLHLPPRDQRVAAIQSEIRQLPARTYSAGDEFARIQADIK